MIAVHGAGITNIILSGGVAQNIKANKLISGENFEEANEIYSNALQHIKMNITITKSLPQYF